MSTYLHEFLALAGLHLLAVASPGPDFALVLRQSLVAGRRAALLSSLGIGTAILLHVAYTVLGVGVLLRASPLAFTCMKWAGAAYLLWLAWCCSKARPARTPSETASQATAPSDSASSGSLGGDRGAFLRGFLTNVLNPKATMFFLALFSVGVSASTPRLVVGLYGLWMAIATAAWFCLVSLCLTHPAALSRFRRNAHWIDWLTGAVMLLFAARLLLAD